MILRIEIEIQDGGDRTVKDKLFGAQDAMEHSIDQVLEQTFDLGGAPAIWRYLSYNVGAHQLGDSPGDRRSGT